MVNPTVYAVILAAGASSRMCCGVKKQRIKLNGVSVLLRSVRAFDAVGAVTGIVVVCREEDMSFAREECREIKKPVVFVIGGENRQESAKLGFSAVPKDVDFVAIHDAARCLVTPKAIMNCLEKAFAYGAASLVCSVTDTVKQAKDGILCQAQDRDLLKLAQTPQIFRTEDYRKALDFSDLNGICATDDNALLDAIGLPVYFVENNEWNPKITTREDLVLAEAILKVRKERNE